MTIRGIVIVGGGNGFIGSAIIKQLKLKNFETITVSRKPKTGQMTWSALQENGLPNGTTAVLNLAGQNVLDPLRGWTSGFKQNVYASRVNTTRYLADAITKAEVKPSVFITASGVGYYPPSDAIEYDEEGDGGNFDFFSKMCTDWENASKLPAELNVRRVAIRCGVVLGRNGGMIKQLFLPFYLGLGGPIGAGTQYMPWIHVHDIAALFVHAIEDNSLTGVVNGVAPELITNLQFTKSFAKALRRPAIFPLPVAVLNMIFSAERAKIMVEGQKVTPKKALEFGFQFRYPDIKSASEEFARLK